MNPDSPLTAPAEAFLRYLRVERQLSPLTQSSYAHQLQVIIDLLSASGIADWQALDAPACERWWRAASAMG